MFPIAVAKAGYVECRNSGMGLCLRRAPDLGILLIVPIFPLAAPRKHTGFSGGLETGLGVQGVAAVSSSQRFLDKASGDIYIPTPCPSVDIFRPGSLPQEPPHAPYIRSSDIPCALAYVVLSAWQHTLC